LYCVQPTGVSHVTYIVNQPCQPPGSKNHPTSHFDHSTRPQRPLSRAPTHTLQTILSPRAIHLRPHLPPSPSRNSQARLNPPDKPAPTPHSRTSPRHRVPIRPERDPIRRTAAKRRPAPRPRRPRASRQGRAHARCGRWARPRSWKGRERPIC